MVQKGSILYALNAYILNKLTYIMLAYKLNVKNRIHSPQALQLSVEHHTYRNSNY